LSGATIAPSGERFEHSAEGNPPTTSAITTFLKKRSVSTVFDEVEGRFLGRPGR
jgi:hypothetical protein